jgi:hypothetical protein
MILTPRVGLRTQRAFFNAALALLGIVEGICDVPDLCLGVIARGNNDPDNGRKRIGFQNGSGAGAPDPSLRSG